MKFWALLVLVPLFSSSVHAAAEDNDLDPNKFLVRSHQTDVRRCRFDAQELAVLVARKMEVRVVGDCVEAPAVIKAGVQTKEPEIFVVLERDDQQSDRVLSFYDYVGEPMKVSRVPVTQTRRGISKSTGKVISVPNTVTNTALQTVSTKSKDECERLSQTVLESGQLPLTTYSLGFLPIRAQCFARADGTYGVAMYWACGASRCPLLQ